MNSSLAMMRHTGSIYGIAVFERDRVLATELTGLIQNEMMPELREILGSSTWKIVRLIRRTRHINPTDPLREILEDLERGISTLHDKQSSSEAIQDLLGASSRTVEVLVMNTYKYAKIVAALLHFSTRFKFSKSRLDSGIIFRCSAISALCRYSLSNRMAPIQRSEIKFLHEEEPKVSIVMILFGDPTLLLMAIEVLRVARETTRWELIVVNNGAEEQQLINIAYEDSRIRIIEVGENRGFGEACNIGAESAHGAYLVFLNHDVVVGDWWLSRLVDAYESDSSIGILGARLLFPDGRIQEAGCEVDVSGIVRQRRRGESVDPEETDQLHDADHVSAACILMSSHLFARIGGFDFRYFPAYYEDVDLSLKIRQLGLRVMFADAVSLVHLEHGSDESAAKGEMIRSLLARNRRMLARKWGFDEEASVGFVRSILFDDLPRSTRQEIMASSPPMSVSVEPALTDEPLAGKSFAIFTPYNLNPGGGESVTLRAAFEAARAGAAVTIIGSRPWSRARVMSVATELGIGLSTLAERVAVETLEAVCDRDPFDYFVSIGNELTPLVWGLGKRSYYLCQFPFGIHAGSIQEQLEVLSTYHGVLVYSEYVRSEYITRAIRHNFPEIPSLEVIYPGVSQFTAIQSPPRVSRILSVGRFFEGGHSKRQDVAIRVFKDLVDAGRISKDWELMLVGSIGPSTSDQAYLTKLREASVGYRIRIAVDEPLDQLVDLYKTSQIYWHLTGVEADRVLDAERFEHFGMTIVEAMSAGCIPMTINYGGPAEIVDFDSRLLWSTAEELANSTVALMEMTEEERMKLRMLAEARAGYFTAERFGEAFLEVLTGSGNGQG